MAFTNFIPEVWAKSIERERDRYCVGVMNCRRDFEGEMKFGDKIHINWTKRPTVKNYDGSDIDSPENLGDKNSYIEINQRRYVNFEVDDVDALQANSDLMASCNKEASAATAEDEDNYVFGLYGDAGVTIEDTTCDETTIIDTINSGITALYTNDVPMTEEIVIEVDPTVYQIMWKAKMLNQTNNTELWQNGFVGQFNNAKVYMTNGIVKTGNVRHCFVRTKKAIGFIGQMKDMEAYRPQSKFTDAVKGLDVYGAAVVRENELVVLDITPASKYLSTF